MYKLCHPVSMSSLNDLFECCIDCHIAIFTLVSCYSGINAGKVAWLESGGECDGLGYPLLSRPVAQQWSSSCMWLGY